MRVLIMGGDGYLGWPTAMHLAAEGHEVLVVDNYLRRTLARQTQSEALMSTPNLHDRADIFYSVSGYEVPVKIKDCADYSAIREIFQWFQPDVAIHYAEQPSAPYSMIGYDQARLTLNNNINTTFNLIWAALEYAPDCHIIKLGSMGEYGTPDIDIEEGWINISHQGRRDKFLYPRQGGSLYHTTKINDTDLLWFYVRTYGLRVTDLMQGPVYGLSTAETDQDERLMPNFYYDDIFGTVINRFLVQAAAGIPLTVYGTGGQTRGYLNLIDTLQCVKLAMETPANKGELRILNQFTEVFSVNQIAEMIQAAGKYLNLDVSIEPIDNPRKEAEDHYYNPAHSGLSDLGLEPHPMTEPIIVCMIEKILKHKNRIDTKKIMPRVRWRW